jgi:hypothetical protein
VSGFIDLIDENNTQVKTASDTDRLDPAQIMDPLQHGAFDETRMIKDGILEPCESSISLYPEARKWLRDSGNQLETDF